MDARTRPLLTRGEVVSAYSTVCFRTVTIRVSHENTRVAARSEDADETCHEDIGSRRCTP